MRATVQHFELPARDLERAARFYREALGWEVAPLTWQGPPYFRIRAALPDPSGVARQGIDGGLTTGGEAVGQPLLMIHVEGATLEECLERIVDAGGAVDLPVQEVSGQGRFARFLDSEGNRLGLWEKA